MIPVCNPLCKIVTKVFFVSARPVHAKACTSQIVLSCEEKAMIVDDYLKSVTFPLSLLHSPIWLFDVVRLRIVWANTAALTLWDAGTLVELQERDLSADISRKVRERIEQYSTDLSGTTNSLSEHWTFYPNGRPSTCECSISAISPPNGERWILVNAISEDTASSSDTLYRSSALLQTSVCVSVYGTDGQLKYANPAARSMLGADEMALSERFHDDADWQKVCAELDKGGQVSIDARVRTATAFVWHNLHLETCPDPVLGNLSILVSETDVSARYHAQQRVNYLAYNDALTSLPNRASWFVNLNSRLETAYQADESLAILFIDLDRFKQINDTLGHAVGDKVLVAMAERLKNCIGENEYLARLGGDEFVLLVKDNPSGQLSGSKAASIVQSLTEVVNINGHELSITPSIGISQWQQGLAHTQLMQQADLAMYAAKEQGCGYLHFKPPMATQLQRRQTIEQDLRVAIDTAALQVYYQPKLCTRTRRVVGSEALLRWNHPTLGWVSPTEFIAVAEESGRIGDVTQYVMHAALAQQARWAKQGHDICIAVNISPLDFRSEHFVAKVRQALDVTECKPERLELEITESMLMSDSDATKTILSELSSLGVRLSLDDFGSGYSNLGYLQKFPLDSIKIDRSFLSDGDISPVIDLIIGVGKKLSLKVVAEGVETIGQRDALVQLGCHQLQGYLFSKPLAEPEATAFLNDRRQCRAEWPTGSEVAA